MHNRYLYDLTSTWYRVVDYFGEYMPDDVNGCKCATDSFGNTPLDLAVVWLSSVITDLTGAIDPVNSSKSMDMSTKMAIRYNVDTELSRYMGQLKHIIVPSWSVNQTIYISVKGKTLIVRTHINGH